MAQNNIESNNIVIFAGGYDAEMVEIIRICREAGVEVVDKHLGWGASTDTYTAELFKAAAEGKTPVLVELDGAERVPGAIVVDHHNENAGKPASILQVLNLLGIQPTRRQLLIAANDSGYIPAMLAMGASAAEVSDIRRADRAAQGITPEQEAEAERAIAAAEVVNGVTIIRMAHSKTATVCDRLFDPEKKQRLLILSEDGESNFFGNGTLCLALQGKDTGKKTQEGYTIYDHFGGWVGGNLPISGFWGGYADQKEVLDFVVRFFEKVWFVNCTPHAIRLNDGTRYEPSGQIARVAQTISDFDKDGIAVQTFGAVTGLPEPQDGVVYIVSALVLSRAQAEGRTDVVSPATGHKLCVRDEAGRIVSVPGFLR